MASVGRCFGNCWHAAKATNWDLAAYFVRRTRSGPRELLPRRHRPSLHRLACARGAAGCEPKIRGVIVDLARLAAEVPDGATVAIGRFSPMALVRELIALGRKDLHLIGVPVGELAVDMLIGAGAVRSIETSGVDLGEHGFAPAFTTAGQ